MADIQRDINQIATARYGREVRGSIVNALTLMNEESSEAIDKAVTAQDSASASAEEARTYADRLVDLSGGTANQVLTKNSNADFDYSWQNSQGGGGGASDAYEVTYGDTNVGDTLDVMPRLSGEVQTVAPAPKDADTLGGRITASDIDAINTDLAEYKSNVLGLKSNQVIRRKAYEGSNLACTVADGNLFRSTAITIDISEFGFKTLSSVKPSIIQTTGNATTIIGASIYGIPTKDEVKFFVWTPTSKTINTYFTVDLECIGTI